MITNKLYNYLLKNGINIEQDIFDYGMKIARIYLCFILVLSILGYIFGIFFEILLFILFFVPLRKFGGGFHFQSNAACFVATVCLILFPILFSELNPFSFNVLVIATFYIINILIVKRIGIVDNENKRIDTNDKIVFLKKLLKVYIINLLISVLFFLSNNGYITIIMLCTFLNTVNMVFGYIANKWNNNV